jgi:uncharacterized protein YjiS (DUF1127 family)
MWFLKRQNLTWTTMEMVMSSTFGMPAAVGDRRTSGLVGTVKAWWLAYLTRRMERAASIQLHAMSDQELQDIGLTRSQIDCAVRGELDQRPFAHHY